MKAKPEEMIPINEAEVNFLTVYLLNIVRIIVERIQQQQRVKDPNIKREFLDIKRTNQPWMKCLINNEITIHNSLFLGMFFSPILLSLLTSVVSNHCWFSWFP